MYSHLPFTQYKDYISEGLKELKGMIGKRPSLSTPFPKKVKNWNHLKDVIEISRSS